MTQEQIKNYEYCKKHLTDLSAMEEKSQFEPQMYGCGSRDERITFELQDIHKDMYNSIQAAIKEAKQKINDKIEKL